MSILGLEGFTFPHLSPSEVVTLAAETGFSATAVRLCSAVDNAPTLTMRHAQALRRQADSEGLELYGADIVDLEGTSAHWDDLLDVVASAGIGRISCFHRGSDLAAAGDRFAKLVIAARQRRITAFVEPVSYFGVRTAADVVELVALAGGGGIVIDTLHVRRSGEDLAMVARAAAQMPVWIQASDANLLAHTTDQLTALRTESLRARLPPGRGICHVAETVRAVLRVTDAPTLMVEAPNAERVATIGHHAYAVECASALRSLLTTPVRTEPNRT